MVSISISHFFLLPAKLFCMSPRVPAPLHALPPLSSCLWCLCLCDQTAKYTYIYSKVQFYILSSWRPKYLKEPCELLTALQWGLLFGHSLASQLSSGSSSPFSPSPGICLPRLPFGEAGPLQWDIWERDGDAGGPGSLLTVAFV